MVLWFPHDTKQVISATFFPANLLVAWYGKTKPNTTKARIHQSTQNKHKIKPGLVTSYVRHPAWKQRGPFGAS